VGDAIWRVLVLILLAAVAAQSILLIALMRQLGGVILQLRPARIGEVEAEEGPEIGMVVDIPGLSAGRPAVAVFVSPKCGICRPLLPAISVLASHYHEIDVLAVVTGDDEAQREIYARDIGQLARPDLHELERAWSIVGTPFAVAIDSQGRITARGVVNSLDQLESLAEALVAENSSEPIEIQEGSEEEAAGVVRDLVGLSAHVESGDRS
jgi:methylamine dehydrogenase accessory protein MauD